jgi:hypothetical protein
LQVSKKLKLTTLFLDPDGLLFAQAIVLFSKAFEFGADPLLPRRIAVSAIKGVDGFLKL